MKWLFLFALGTAALVSCGDEFETEEGPDRPCNENPWSCPKDQTCWPNSSNSFACLNEGPGEVNESCNLTTSAPQCAEGLLCYQTDPGVPGVCRPFCDPSNAERACPDNAVCDRLLLTETVEVRICRPL